MSEAQYKHSPLEHRSSIRLLILLPDEYGTPLRCHITEFQRDQAPSYEAISYTWDELVFPKAIHISDSTSSDVSRFAITQNLYNGLQRLRGHQPRTLWIDALCINQEDLGEKGHQVAHMGDIYREANRVVV